MLFSMHLRKRQDYTRESIYPLTVELKEDIFGIVKWNSLPLAHTHTHTILDLRRDIKDTTC